VFNIKTENEFNALALETFHFQYQNLKLYQDFVDYLKVKPKEITNFEQIPFLPIEMFKNHELLIGDSFEKVFTSSGTTGVNTSKHYIKDLSIYETSFLKAFDLFYGDLSTFCVIGLLPSYLEREGSSLIYMVDSLIEKSGSRDSQFCLSLTDELLSIMKDPNQPCLVFGVTYALLDLAEENIGPFHNTIFMETGGMKGKRKEMIKSELHSVLKQGLQTDEIHSEYGMTELLSQAYSLEKGLFDCPPWMKILIREVQDPLTLRKDSKTGGINVIDLANKYSCSFIATQDLGRIHENGQFEIMGRFDHSDIRGCNLLLS
jgi:phenylacetate-coenzyme A ligase PaaK-like adenylate-forming protein